MLVNDFENLIVHLGALFVDQLLDVSVHLILEKGLLSPSEPLAIGDELAVLDAARLDVTIKASIVSAWDIKSGCLRL